MSMPVVVSLHRNNIQESWGFRLSGGRDYRQVLSVKKVQPQSPASHCLSPGDSILSIGNTNAHNLTHMQAHQLIKSAGNMLQLTVEKCGGQDIDRLRPKGPVKFSPWKSNQVLNSY
ncbi:hypothetical protein SNE40_004102 [Patella caerulea]|uniref:PDZ domain-containing protein n=1 Tax=Patella caerulea TaxID=87958 RepID=A0AAN8K483_PATCE